MNNPTQHIHTYLRFYSIKFKKAVLSAVRVYIYNCYNDFLGRRWVVCSSVEQNSRHKQVPACRRQLCPWCNGGQHHYKQGCGFRRHQRSKVRTFQPHTSCLICQTSLKPQSSLVLFLNGDFHKKHTLSPCLK